MSSRSPGDRPDLSTKRLSLRCPHDRDIGSIVSIVGNLEVARRLARVPHPYGTGDARFFLDRVVPSEWVWAVTLRGSATLIGAVGLTPEENGNTAELGYWLAPTHWGVGIATEAANAIVSFGFGRPGFDGLTSGYFEDNAASARVLGKLGFVEAGRDMRACLALGSAMPSIRMALSRLAWSARNHPEEDGNR